MSDGSFVAGADELEEQVGGFGFEGDVADFVDDEQRVAAEADEFGLQPAGVVGVGEAGDPFRRGGEQDPVPGLACPDRRDRSRGGSCRCRAGRGTRRCRLAVTKSRVPRCAMRSRFSAAGMVEVELLQRLAGRETGGADAALPAVGFPGGDFPLQAGDEELLVGPGLGRGLVRRAG